MKLHIKVTHSGQAKTVETSLAIIVAWEQAGYKKEHGDFDKWLEQLEDLEVIDSRESHPTE